MVKLRDGGIQRSVWSTEKVNAHKEKYSQGWRRAEGKGKDSPWHTAWETMAKKTVIRDMIQRGLVPLSAEYTQLVERTTVVDEDGEPIAGMDLIPDRSEGVDDLRTIDESTEPQGEDELDKLLDGLHDSQDRASFYKKAINSTLDKELLQRLRNIIEADEGIDTAEREILCKAVEKRIK